MVLVVFYLLVCILLSFKMKTRIKLRKTVNLITLDDMLKATCSFTWYDLWYIYNKILLIWRVGILCKKLNSTFLYLHQVIYVIFPLLGCVESWSQYCSLGVYVLKVMLFRLCCLGQVNLIILFYNSFAYLNSPYQHWWEMDSYCKANVTYCLLVIF